MKRNNPAVFVALLFAFGCATFAAYAAMDDAGQTSGQTSGMTSGQKDAQTVINKWPAKTKTAAQVLIQKYGQPDTVKSGMLAWNNKGEWHRIAVYRESFKSAVGLSHENFIENTIGFAVPSDKMADLKKFDRALLIDHSKGTLASRGASEKVNILALNLANEVVSGQRSADDAKAFLEKTKSQAMAGKSSPYMEKLMFTPSNPTPGQPASQPQKTPPSGY